MLYIGLANRQTFLCHLTDDRVLILVTMLAGSSLLARAGRHHFQDYTARQRGTSGLVPTKRHFAFKDMTKAVHQAHTAGKFPTAVMHYR